MIPGAAPVANPGVVPEFTQRTIGHLKLCLIVFLYPTPVALSCCTTVNAPDITLSTVISQDSPRTFKALAGDLPTNNAKDWPKTTGNNHGVVPSLGSG